MHSQDHEPHVCAPTPNTYPSADFSAELTPYPNLPSPSLHLRDPREAQLASSSSPLSRLSLLCPHLHPRYLPPHTCLS